MLHPIETTVSSLVSSLRSMTAQQPLPANGEVFIDGLLSHYDSNTADIHGRCRVGENTLFELSLIVQRPGRWCTLSLRLGSESLPEASVIGVVADIAASCPVQIELTLRSFVDGTRIDVPFEDQINTGPEGGVQVALLTATEGSVLCREAVNKMLVLHLPQITFDLVLRDLRVFVSTANKGQSIFYGPA